jgi:hypothetical protein
VIGNKGLRFGDVCGEVVVHDGVFEDGEPVLPVGVAIFLRLPQTGVSLKRIYTINCLESS